MSVVPNSNEEYNTNPYQTSKPITYMPGTQRHMNSDFYSNNIAIHNFSDNNRRKSSVVIKTEEKKDFGDFIQAILCLVYCCPCYSVYLCSLACDNEKDPVIADKKRRSSMFGKIYQLQTNNRIIYEDDVQHMENNHFPTQNQIQQMYMNIQREQDEEIKKRNEKKRTKEIIKTNQG